MLLDVHNSSGRLIIETIKRILGQRKYLKVVLIDDDQDDAQLVSDLLKLSGFSCELEWISDAASGLERIKSQDAAIYLLDYRLGASTGVDLLEQIKPLMLERPVILLTGIDDRETDLAAMEAGAWDYLTKGHLTAENLERSIRYCLCRANDLAKLRSAERAKLELETIQAANRAKTEFLAHMSHEIRSPLTAVLGFTKLALEPSCQDSERLEFLEIIKRSGDHLLKVVNDILDVSKIEEGRLELEMEKFDWLETVNEVVSILRPTAQAKGLRLETEIQHDLEKLMVADSHRLRQILFNLLGNAIKFTHTGLVKLTVMGGQQPHSIRFDVADSGIGMTDAERSKVFEPFTQGNASLSRRFGGTGLGLSLSKSLADAMGGKLSIIKTEIGKGSTFGLELPLPPLVAATSPSSQPIALPVSTVESKPLKVLLVEDSPDNRLLIKHFLRFEDIDLTFANDGQAGIDAAENENFDAILMDIQMPIVDGYEATRRLRENGYDGPIIALTAHALTAERERVMRSGFDGFVSKPMKPSQLVETLRSVRRHELHHAIAH